jgi:hypothetical protein
MSTRKTLLCLSLTLGAVSVGVLIVVVVGSVQGLQGINTLFTNFNTDTLGYFKNLLNEINTMLYIDGSSLIQSAELAPLQSTLDKLGNVSSSVSSKLDGLNNVIAYTAASIACVPLILAVLTLVFRFYSCRRFAPNGMSCCTYLFAVIFFAVSAVCLFVTPIWTDFCDEIDLQYSDSPGIFQWYVVPYCNSLAQFSSLQSTMLGIETNYSETLCTILSQTCSNAPTFVAAQDYFYCPMVSPSYSCENYTSSVRVLNGTFAKAGSPVCGGVNCTWRQCATECTNATLAAVANASITTLAKANAGFQALNVVLPLLSCNFLVNITLETFSSCRQIQNGIYMTGLGLMLGGIALFFIGFLFLNGAHTWANDEELDELRHKDGLEMGSYDPRTSHYGDVGEV